MPRVGEVAGFDIYIQDERRAKHRGEHCHVRGGGFEATFNLRTLQIWKGSLPRNKMKPITDWLRRHQGELLENYDNLQNGYATYWIGD